MPYRFLLFFVFFTGLFLFYPGNSQMYRVFSLYPEAFTPPVAAAIPQLNPIPVVQTTLQPTLTAQGVYVVDLTSFTPVFERNADRTFYPASTTKVITALVAQDVYSVDDVVTVNRVLNEGQVMGLVQGEEITVENLLYGSLVHSGNDAAFALANHYGYEEFIRKMNEKAQELGMKNSQFYNPTGLDDSRQVSSPYDLALAGRAILTNPLLRKMVSTKQITVSDIDFKIFHPLTNVNQLLGEIPGLGGLKTGYTEAAGQNLISFYRRPDDSEFLIVVLKSEDRFADTVSIISWLNSNVTFVEPEVFLE